MLEHHTCQWHWGPGSPSQLQLEFCSSSRSQVGRGCPSLFISLDNSMLCSRKKSLRKSRDCVEKTDHMSMKDVPLNTCSTGHLGQMVGKSMWVFWDVSTSLVAKRFETATHQGIHIRVFPSFTLS